MRQPVGATARITVRLALAAALLMLLALEALLAPSARAAATHATAAAARAQPGASPGPPLITPPPPSAPQLFGPAPHPIKTPQQILSADAVELTELSNQAQTVSNDARLAQMGAAAEAIDARARGMLASANSQLASVDRQLAGILPGRRRPTAAEATRAAPLQARKAALQAEAKEAQAVVTAADAAFKLVAERRRQGFTARVLTRAPSPFEPAFWSELTDAAGGDTQRLQLLLDDEWSTVAAAPEPQALLRLGAGILAALALFPVRRWLLRLVRPARRRGVRPSSFERSGAGLATVVVDTLAPGLAAALARIAAEWGGLLSPDADALASAAVAAVVWAAAIVALGRVLATDGDPDYRLLKLTDNIARRVRPPIAVVALVTAAGFVLSRINYIVGASVAATIAADCVLSIAYSAVAGLVVVSFGRGWAHSERGEASSAARAPAWTLISVILTFAIAVTLGAVVLGYSTLAATVSSQVFWLGIIVAAAYVLIRFADDLTTGLFGDNGLATRALLVLFGLSRSAIGQAGALISAALQVAIVMGALSLALTPVGQGGNLLAANLSGLARPFRVGSAVISPVDILSGLATLVIGVGLARVVQRWVNRRYLPVTDWDAGVRNSVSTGIGYLGIIVAILGALTASGIGFNQITLIASALGVGIGFGLQQIVQNFVAGVILLVERPVKVGDWVNVGGVEGDIRRIRVRATEIETFDRSTVIVPNSDLITKAVQNKTLGALGRVELRLSITDAAEAPKGREIIVDALKGRPGVSRDRPPAVLIDSLAATGGANLTCYVYVTDPRQGASVRSDSYLQVIEALKKAGVAFTGVPP